MVLDLEQLTSVWGDTNWQMPLVPKSYISALRGQMQLACAPAKTWESGVNR